MLRLAADENLNGEIVRGLFRRQPDLDLVRIQDVELIGADDPTVLEWSASEERILVTHDRATIPAFAYDRVRSGLSMPGVFAINDRLPIRQAIEELLVLIHGSEASEWQGIVLYLPL